MKNRFAAISIIAVALATGIAAADCGADHGNAMTASAKPDIVDTAVAAGNFNTLVAAVKAAGLAEALKGDGPFTVFAPNDAAFAKLPAGTVEALLQDKDKLAEILTYHVISGKFLAADVLNLTSAKTLQGSSVSFDTSNGVMVNNAKVIATDIETSNGVIHVIDTVLLPESDIVDTARGAGSFNTLLAAVEAAGLTETLRVGGPFTVFAPTDAAFAKLPEGTVAALLKDKEKLRSILLYHVLAGEVTAKQVVKLTQAKTAMGQSFSIHVGEGGVRVDDANVVKTDIMTGNGVIHVIDSVIIPQA
jgi:uncharacterized surface protein with fasciclin (FAS1) repeats